MRHKLDTLENLLASGGDARLIRDANGMNKYGCFSVPHPEILSYCSSTASTISTAGYAAAERLYHRLATAAEESPVIYAREMQRLRKEIVTLCDLATLPGLDIILGASGTDMHLFAAQLLCRANASLLVIMIEPAETGSGVPAAIRGYDFSNRTASVMAAEGVEIAVIPSRQPDGNLRPASIVDTEVEELVSYTVAQGKHVLLTLTDMSKTGIISPSPQCVISLKQRFAGALDVMVDACQFRLANATLRAYLERDLLVAVTGSKFVTGPAFSGALLVPPAMKVRLSMRELPPVLCLYSASADWPQNWTARGGLINRSNYGLLLRWEAALAEMRAFHALAETDVRTFLENFAAAVSERIANNPAFEALPVAEINRSPLPDVNAWDNVPTVFPFLMHAQSGKLLGRDETNRVYEMARKEKIYLGQPVICGRRDGVNISALRLCVDMRLIIDALSTTGRGEKAVITGALNVLDKTAELAKSIT